MKTPSSEDLIKFSVNGLDSPGGFVDEANLYKALGMIEIRASTLKGKCEAYIGAIVLERLNQLDYRTRVADQLSRVVDASIAAKSAYMNAFIQREIEALVREKVAEYVSAMTISATVDVV